MKSLLKSFRPGPVAKAAAVLIEQRIEKAEAAFAADAETLEQVHEVEVAALEARLEAETRNTLQKHVNCIFTIAS